MTAERSPLDGLIVRVSHGDQAAMGLLYDTLAPGIFTRILTRVDELAALDVTRDVFVDVWRRARQFDPSNEQFGDWLQSITDECIGRRAELRAAV